jgi:hypothetical protein
VVWKRHLRNLGLERKFIFSTLDALLLLLGVVLVYYRVRVSLWVVVVNIALLVSLLGLIEIGLIFFMNNPGTIPARFLSDMRRLYWATTKWIQYNEQSARYDNDLTYVLRPGEFVFSTLEFSTRYRVNSFGLRDDEESLNAPEIIVLGDSYAMGWGVEQDETFPEVLQQESGLKVLNAAVSSYGTVRELTSFDRYDRSNLKYLIIQYYHNDFRENRVFLEHDGKLPIMSEEAYDDRVRGHTSKKQYVFGRYLLMLIANKGEFLVSRLSGRAGNPTQRHAVAEGSASEAAKVFLEVLKRFGIEKLEVPVIVLDVYKDSVKGGGFIEALSATIQSKAREYPNVKVIDLSKHLNGSHFYIFDVHLNSEGHRVLAREILKAMERY